MPYPADLVGKYIAYTVDPGGNMHAGLVPQLANGLLPGQTTAAVAAVYVNGPPPLGAPQGVQGGANAAVTFVAGNATWGFAFLKYFGGAVTVAPIAGGVLTGPMSGCYLFKYTEGGQQHLAHVGTANSEDSDASINAKSAWRTFAALPGVSAISGGAPADYFEFAEIKAALMGVPTGPASFPMVAGYFDNGGSAFALLLSPVPSSMRPPVPLLRVVGVKVMTLQPWSTIVAMRRFRS